jgi:hypothetical protein
VALHWLALLRLVLMPVFNTDIIRGFQSQEEDEIMQATCNNLCATLAQDSFVLIGRDIGIG